MPNQLSGGTRFLLGVISFLLCILLFASAIATITVANAVTIFTSKENLKSIFSQVLFSEISRPALRSIGTGGNVASARPTVKPLAAPALRLDEAVSEQQTTDALVSWIFDTLSEEYGDKMDVTFETVQTFVEQSTLKEFIADKGASLISDFYTGENTTTLTKEEIQEQLELNRDLIKDTFHYDITDEELEDIATTVTENDYIAQIQEEGIVNVVMGAVSGVSGENSADASQNLLPQLLESSRAIASPSTLLACIGICLVLVALLLVTNIRQIWVGMNKAGITLMVASALFLIPTIALWVQPVGWADDLGSLRIVAVLIRHILILTSGACIAVFSVGIALLAGGITTKCVIHIKYRMAFTAAAPVATEFVPVSVTPTCADTQVFAQSIADVEIPTETPAETEAPAVADDTM